MNARKKATLVKRHLCMKESSHVPPCPAETELLWSMDSMDVFFFWAHELAGNHGFYMFLQVFASHPEINKMSCRFSAKPIGGHV